MGKGAGNNHGLVILEGGELWSAGRNGQGQLGIGNTTNASSFVKVDLGEKKAISALVIGQRSWQQSDQSYSRPKGQPEDLGGEGNRLPASKQNILESGTLAEDGTNFPG